MSLDNDSKIPSWRLRTSLKQIAIFGAPQGSLTMVVFVDEHEEWRSNICPSKYMWHGNHPLYFRASTKITIQVLSSSVGFTKVPSNMELLGSFSGNLVDLYGGDDIDIQIGGIRGHVKLDPIEGAYPLNMVDCDYSLDRVMDTLGIALEHMMDMVDVMKQSSKRLQVRKIMEPCHILFSVHKTWKGDVPVYDHIVDMVDSLRNLCERGRNQVSKPDTDIVKITNAVGNSVVRVASLLDECLRFSLDALEDDWTNRVKVRLKTAQEHCQYSESDF